MYSRAGVSSIALQVCADSGQVRLFRKASSSGDNPFYLTISAVKILAHVLLVSVGYSQACNPSDSSSPFEDHLLTPLEHVYMFTLLEKIIILVPQG